MNALQKKDAPLHEKFPRLAMTISMDDETLSGACESPEPSEKRLISNARSWLQACASAQRLIDGHDLGVLFQGRPLEITIENAHIARPLAGLPTPMVDFGCKTIAKTAFQGARALFSLSKAVAQASKLIDAAGLPNVAKAISLKGEEWLSVAEIHQLAVANGPHIRTSATLIDADDSGAARIINRRETMILPALSPREEFNGFKTAHMSATEFALHIVVHEAGHVAQMRSSGERPAVLGGPRDAEMEPLFEAMGLLSPSAGFLSSTSATASEQYAHLCTLFFQESYADCFSVLTRAGGASKEAMDETVLSTMAYRSAQYPASVEHYGRHSTIHDTREALAELRERLSIMDTFPRGEAIGALCVECAQLGMMRWAQNIALNRTGKGSLLLWEQAAERAESLGLSQLSQEYAASLLADVNKLKKQAMQITHLAPRAACLAQESDNVGGHGLALGILMKMNELAGAPRCPLAGSLPTSPTLHQEPSISKKIEALRDGCARIAVKMSRHR